MLKLSPRMLGDVAGNVENVSEDVGGVAENVAKVAGVLSISQLLHPVEASVFGLSQLRQNVEGGQSLHPIGHQHPHPVEATVFCLSRFDTLSKQRYFVCRNFHTLSENGMFYI